MLRASFCTPLRRAVPLALMLACQAAPPPAAPCPPAPEAVESSAAPAAPGAPRRLVVGNSELLDLHSEQTGRDYEVIVGLPDSYGKEPERRYPVLYLLDGQWDFNLINTLTGGLRYDKVVPEYLIVGISYAGDAPDYGKLRGEDYTPTRAHPAYAKAPYGGDGAKFLQFLEQSLLPAVEQRYRVDTSQRMLAGSSLGGLFTLYALFEEPDLFQSYLALSPAVGWDDRYIFRREREFRAQRARLDKRVWLSVGELEWPDYVKNDRDFFAQLEESRYEGLSLGVQVVPGERHAGVKPEAFNRALRFAFEPWMAAQKVE